MDLGTILVAADRGASTELRQGPCGLYLCEVYYLSYEWCVSIGFGGNRAFFVLDKGVVSGSARVNGSRGIGGFVARCDDVTQIITVLKDGLT